VAADDPVKKEPQQKWNHGTAQKSWHIIDRAELEELPTLLDPVVTLGHDWRQEIAQSNPAPKHGVENSEKPSHGLSPQTALRRSVHSDRVEKSMTPTLQLKEKTPPVATGLQAIQL
jgi:hypothetical protein